MDSPGPRTTEGTVGAVSGGAIIGAAKATGVGPQAAARLRAVVVGVLRSPLRLPFTLISLAGLIARAVRTNSTTGDAPSRVLERVGFAPRDLVLFGWRRIIQSALFTHGGIEFWLAVAMIALAVGAAEILVGTVRSFIAFWGVHVATLLVESLFVAMPLAIVGAPIGTRLSDVRDVGPSAGYVGALGMVCAQLPPKWRYGAAAVVMASLLAITLMPAASQRVEAAQLSAGLAHLIAFPLGLALGAVWRPRLAAAHDFATGG